MIGTAGLTVLFVVGLGRHTMALGLNGPRWCSQSPPQLNGGAQRWDWPRAAALGPGAGADNLWPCPGLTDTPDRLNGLRGVDGGEQQTAPGLSGCVQARGGGCDPQRPLGFGGGGRVWPAGFAGGGFATPGGGADGGRPRGGRGGPHPAARGRRRPAW